jgi:hypothetical protein
MQDAIVRRHPAHGLVSWIRPQETLPEERARRNPSCRDESASTPVASAMFALLPAVRKALGSASSSSPRDSPTPSATCGPSASGSMTAVDVVTESTGLGGVCQCGPLNTETKARQPVNGVHS